MSRRGFSGSADGQGPGFTTEPARERRHTAASQATLPRPLPLPGRMGVPGGLARLEFRVYAVSRRLKAELRAVSCTYQIRMVRAIDMRQHACLLVASKR